MEISTRQLKKELTRRKNKNLTPEKFIWMTAQSIQNFDLREIIFNASLHSCI